MHHARPLRHRQSLPSPSLLPSPLLAPPPPPPGAPPQHVLVGRAETQPQRLPQRRSSSRVAGNGHRVGHPHARRRRGCLVCPQHPLHYGQPCRGHGRRGTPPAGPSVGDSGGGRVTSPQGGRCLPPTTPPGGHHGGTIPPTDGRHGPRHDICAACRCRAHHCRHRLRPLAGTDGGRGSTPTWSI